ncbi:MAG: hypothetical protein E6Q56_12025 [Mycobacterium sp.]|nr:MAG: hypothetical protein E6Q56_12025 [Mycobacterium sp.]
MNSSMRFARKVAVLTGSAAVVAAAAAGCSSDKKPETTTTPSSSAPSSSPAQPTEKNLSPTGGNSFSPEVKAPPAPTGEPGRHRY